MGRMAWDVNAHSSIYSRYFSFSPLRGSRYNGKSMHFEVRLAWIAGVDYEVGVPYRRHWGEKGEGDMSSHSVSGVDRHRNPSAT